MGEILSAKMLFSLLPIRKLSLVNETLRPKTETRPRRLKNASRDRLETETSRPRLHP